MRCITTSVSVQWCPMVRMRLVFSFSKWLIHPLIVLYRLIKLQPSSSSTSFCVSLWSRKIPRLGIILGDACSIHVFPVFPGLAFAPSFLSPHVPSVRDSGLLHGPLLLKYFSLSLCLSSGFPPFYFFPILIIIFRNLGVTRGFY